MSDTLFRLNDGDIIRKHRVERLLDPLRIFGLLNAKEVDKISAVLLEAECAEASGHNVKRRAQAACATIAERVLNGEADLDTVDAAVAAIPDPAGVIAVAQVVATRLIWKAEELTFAHIDTAVATINRELDAISNRAVELAADLEGVDDAEAALTTGKGEAWLELRRLHSHYETIAALIEELRDAGKLPYAERVEYGSWWRTRRPANLGMSNYYKDARDPLLLFLDTAVAGLYLPASEDEAEQTRRAHEAEAAELRKQLR